MRKTIREHGFKYWLNEVYLYHYKMHTAIALGVVLAVVLIIVTFEPRVRVDFRFTLVSENGIRQNQLRVIESALLLHDISAEGTLILFTPEAGSANAHQDLMQSLADMEHTLFLVTESMMDLFRDILDEFYDKIPLHSHAFFAETQLDEEPLYAIVKRTRRFITLRTNASQVEAAKAALQILFAYPEGF